jgi:hypothetical protein
MILDMEMGVDKKKILVFYNDLDLNFDLVYWKLEIVTF